MDTSPIGSDRLNLWLRRRREAVDLERQLVRIAEEVGADLPAVTSATAAGDPRRLRGIPAIGYGTSGAIAGSQPEREAIRPNRSVGG